MKVGAKGRLDVADLRQAEGHVKFPHLAQRVLLKLLEADLVEVTSGNQGALLEEGVVKLLVLADDAFGPVNLVRALETAERQSGRIRVYHGLEDAAGVAVDVDESGVGEHVQEELDPTGVRRRLQDEWLAISQHELLEEQAE